MKITIKEYELDEKRRYVADVKVGQYTYSTNDGSLNRLFKWCKSHITYHTQVTPKMGKK